MKLLSIFVMLFALMSISFANNTNNSSQNITDGELLDQEDELVEDEPETIQIGETYWEHLQRRSDAQAEAEAEALQR